MPAEAQLHGRRVLYATLVCVSIAIASVRRNVGCASAGPQLDVAEQLYDAEVRRHRAAARRQQPLVFGD